MKLSFAFLMLPIVFCASAYPYWKIVRGLFAPYLDAGLFTHSEAPSVINCSIVRGSFVSIGS